MTNHTHSPIVLVACTALTNNSELTSDSVVNAHLNRAMALSGHLS